MIWRSYVVVVCAAGLLAWYLYGGFGNERHFAAPIAIVGGAIVVRNDTDREWRDVVVTVNHHFNRGARSLAPGGRLSAPLAQFETSHGQRFDRSRQAVFKVEVKATDGAGEAVQLEWESRTPAP